MMNGDLKKFNEQNQVWTYDEFLDAFGVDENAPIGHEETKNDEMVDIENEAFGDVNVTPKPQSTEQVDDFEEASTEMCLADGMADDSIESCDNLVSPWVECGVTKNETAGNMLGIQEYRQSGRMLSLIHI